MELASTFWCGTKNRMSCASSKSRMIREQSIQSQLWGEEAFRCAVEALFDRCQRLEIVIAGWIDQAVLEFHSCLKSDKRCLPKMLAELDIYRPAENGDSCFYLADFHYNEAIVAEISFESRTIDVKCYRRKQRSDDGC